jgi:hypothetical protein
MNPIYIFFILIHLTSGIDYFNNYRYNIEKSTPFYCSEYCYSYDYAESIYNKKMQKNKQYYNLIFNMSNMSNKLILVK